MSEIGAFSVFCVKGMVVLQVNFIFSLFLCLGMYDNEFEKIDLEMKINCKLIIHIVFHSMINRHSVVHLII